MKLVIDTSVLIAFALNNPRAVQIFNKIFQGEHIFYVSPEILYEYKNVLRLKKFKFSSDLQFSVINKISEHYIERTPNNIIKFSRDKDDSPFISLADEVKADYLITEDKTLQKAGHLVNSKIINMEYAAKIL